LRGVSSQALGALAGRESQELRRSLASYRFLAPQAARRWRVGRARAWRLAVAEVASANEGP
jgi:hypothetical protein